MALRAFSTAPPMPWNDSSERQSITERLEILISRAAASDNSFSRGEWMKLWKAVGEVMGNSAPVEVCDPAQDAEDYLHRLIRIMGGTIGTAPTRLEYKLNGIDQYFDILDEDENGSFLFVYDFQGTVGIEQYIASHPTANTHIRYTASGDLEIKIQNDPIITIPSATVGAISDLHRIEIGRANRSVRVRVDGAIVYALNDHGNGKFGAQYIGANENLTSFSDGRIFNIQFTNKNGDHFYAIDDGTQTLTDDGTIPFDGQIINYDPSGWVQA